MSRHYFSDSPLLSQDKDLDTLIKHFKGHDCETIIMALPNKKSMWIVQVNEEYRPKVLFKLLDYINKNEYRLLCDLNYYNDEELYNHTIELLNEIKERRKQELNNKTEQKTLTEIIRQNQVLKEMNSNNNNKGDDVMNNNNMFGNFFSGLDFGPVESGKLSLSTEGIAVKTTNGYLAYNSNKNKVVNVDGVNFEVPNMFFKVPVAINKIKHGDLLIHSGQLVWVIEKKERTISVLSLEGSEIKEILPIESAFGFSYYTSIVSLINNFNADETNPFGSILPFLLAGGTGNDNKVNPLMFLFPQLMSGSDENSGFNPETMAMLMALGNNTGGMESMLPLMLMNGNGFESMDKTMMLAMLMSGNNGGGNNMAMMLMLPKLLESKKTKEVHSEPTDNE